MTWRSVLDKKYYHVYVHSENNVCHILNTRKEHIDVHDVKSIIRVLVIIHLRKVEVNSIDNNKCVALFIQKNIMMCLINVQNLM